LVVLTGIWRSAFDRRLWMRAIGLVVATGWGAGVAAVQLGPSWEFARLVGQTHRPMSDRLFYSFPPLHWFELAVPRLIRELRGGPEDPYWLAQQTTGYEAALYVGTIPLIFALVAVVARPVNRSTLPWLVLVPVSLALATMPRWWPQGYLYVLALPGLGYFRAPARYTLITSLGLAILAGDGLAQARSATAFGRGVGASLIFATCAAIAAMFWTMRADVHVQTAFGGIAGAFYWALVAWSIALVIMLAWHLRGLGSWAPVAAAAVELGILYYNATTQWGWPVALERSPVLEQLSDEPAVGLVGGELGNLPVRAGLRTGYPYVGYLLPRPLDLLNRLQDPLIQSELLVSANDSQAEVLKRWLRRLRVSHVVGHRRAWLALGTELGQWHDPALDQIVYRTPAETAHRAWSVVQLDEPFPEARVVSRCQIAPDRRTLVNRLSRWDDLDIAWFLADDGVAEHVDARSARLASWDGSVATVEHDGSCYLVIARTFDPGWRAHIENEVEQPVLPVDGGFQAVRLDGSGVHRVHMSYRPPLFHLWIAITTIAATIPLFKKVSGTFY
jgi:hypothetical protein